MSHIPEDRLKMGSAVNCTIRDNLILNRYYQKPYCKGGILDNKSFMICRRICAKILMLRHRIPIINWGRFPAEICRK